MPAPQDNASPLNSAAGSGSVRRLVRFLPSATGDDRQPVRLLPSGRFTPAILPIVGSATRAACGGDDLGGGVVREVGGEGPEERRWAGGPCECSVPGAAGASPRRSGRWPDQRSGLDGAV